MMRRWLAAAAFTVVAALFLLQLGHGLWIPEETSRIDGSSGTRPDAAGWRAKGSAAARRPIDSAAEQRATGVLTGQIEFVADRRVIDGATVPWLDATVQRVAIAVAPSPRGARTGHVVLALAAIVAVALAARALRRRVDDRDRGSARRSRADEESALTTGRELQPLSSSDLSDLRSESEIWIAAALLVATPAFVLAGRSVMGGVSAVAPVALATWGLVELREEPRRNALVLAVIGIILSVGSVGILGAIAPVLALLSIGRGVMRVRRAEVPVAWLVAVAVAIVAGLVGIGVAALLGGRLLPQGALFGGNPLSVVLGLLPFALVLPTRRTELLAHAIAWLIPALLWPADPWLRLAPAAPLAINAALAAGVGRRRRVIAAVAAVVVAAIACLAFQDEPARLAGAHLHDPTVLADAALHFGRAGWMLLAVAGLGCAALAIQRLRTAALALVLAATAVIAWTAALHAVPAVSARRSIEPLVAAAAGNGAPVEAALDVPAHRVALGSRVRALAGTADAIAMLDGSACGAVLVPLGELVDVERARRGRVVVLAATQGFAVATACPRLLGAPNADPLREVLLDHLPPRWGKPADAAFDGLRLRAVKMPDRVSSNVRAIDAAFAFEVTGPLSAEHRIALRIDGCKRATGLIQPLAVEPARLRTGEVIVHRVKLPLDDLPPCRYKVGVAWGAAGTRPAVVKAFELR
jgi:hypothetical protein